MAHVINNINIRLMLSVPEYGDDFLKRRLMELDGPASQQNNQDFFCSARQKHKPRLEMCNNKVGVENKTLGRLK